MPPCKLCGEAKKLIDAHIIPKSFYDFSNRDLGPTKVISNAAGQFPKRTQTGIYDNTILCNVCDGFFGKFDQHVAENLLNAKDSTYLKNGTRALAGVYPAADPNIIVDFALSMLLRAAWSSHRFFEKVNLGPFEGELIEHFAKKKELSRNFDTSLAEFDHRNVPIMDPYRIKIDGVNFWHFNAGRFEFYIKVDKRKTPNCLSETSLRSRSETVTVMRQWRGSNQRSVMQDLTLRVEKRHGDLWPRKAR